MRVLLVEDDVGLRESLTELVSELSDVTAVGTLAEALAALGAQRFELVMTDLSLHGNIEAGGAIVRAARERLMPCVIMTGSADNRWEALRRQLLPDGFLPKPFAVEDALHLVERFQRAAEVAERLGRGAEPRACDWVGVGAGRQVAAQVQLGQWERLATATPLSTLNSADGRGAFVVRGHLRSNGRSYGPGQYLFAGPFTDVRAHDGDAWVVTVPV